MYKTHISKWGLDKKNKDHEMRAVVRKYRHREAQGKRSKIHIRGKERSFEEIVRYWK